MPTGLIIKEGYIFIGVSLLVAFLCGAFISPYVAVVPFVLALFFAYFFRNPKRTIPQDPFALVSPADGKVMDVSEAHEDLFLNEECKKVTIFLSVFDVHSNRAPMEGNITFRQYTMGQYKPAYESSVGYVNERHSIGIDNGKMTVLVTQIAGLLARRIVSWVNLGDTLEKGQLYGMIKFGSCTEIFMPKEVEVLVKKGDRVVGGETIIARLNNE